MWHWNGKMAWSAPKNIPHLMAVAVPRECRPSSSGDLSCIVSLTVLCSMVFWVDWLDKVDPPKGALTTASLLDSFAGKRPAQDNDLDMT